MIPAAIWHADSVTPITPCVDSDKALRAAAFGRAIELTVLSRWKEAKAITDFSTAADESVTSERAMRVTISGTLCASFPKPLMEKEALSITA